MADHVQATFWYVLPSLPMFLLVPVLLRRGFTPASIEDLKSRYSLKR